MKKVSSSLVLLGLIISFHLSSVTTSTQIPQFADNFEQQNDVSPSQASWNTVNAGSIIQVVNFERNMTAVINNNRIWLHNGRNVSRFENPINLTIVVYNDLIRTLNIVLADRTTDPSTITHNVTGERLHVNASIWNNETGKELQRLEVASQEFEFLSVLGPELAYNAWKPDLGSSKSYLVSADYLETPQDETECLGQIAFSTWSLRTPTPAPADFTTDDPFNVPFSPLGNFFASNTACNEVQLPFPNTFDTIRSYDGEDNSTVGGRPQPLFLHDNFTRIREILDDYKGYADLSGTKNTYNDSATAATLLTYTRNTQRFSYFETTDIFQISYFSEFAYQFNEENSLNANHFNFAISPTYYNLYEYTIIGNKISKVVEYYNSNYITNLTAKGFDNGDGTTTEEDVSRYNRVAFKFNTSVIDGYLKNSSTLPTSTTDTTSTDTTPTGTVPTGTTPSEGNNSSFFSFSNPIVLVGIITVSSILIIIIVIFVKRKFRR